MEFFIVFFRLRNNKKIQQMNPSLMIAHGECEKEGNHLTFQQQLSVFLVSCLLFAFDYRNCKVTKLMDILRTPHSGYQKIVLNSLPNSRSARELRYHVEANEAYVMLFSLATLLYNT